MKREMKRALMVFAVTTVLGLIGVSVLVRIAWTYGERPGGTAQGKVEIEIPPGAGAGEVADRLAAAGLIGNPAIFRLYAGQRGVASRFKAGKYEIAAPASPRQILEVLVKGAADELVAVVIPPGKNLVDVAEILDAAGITPRAAVLMKASDPAFAAELGLPGATLEGYLFPDTYKLRPHTPAARALIPMVRRHRQVFAELKATHAASVAELKKTLGFDDAKIVTLASIVEKETGRGEERPRIAQVFINRLRFPTFSPKLLQTDPTIIYGCTVATPRSAACLKWDGRIRRIQLDDRDNPYNTYTHEGLPPGPISNPGRAALEAVMAPDRTPFLYFVAKADGTGSHYFSKTVAEHNAAVVKYQRGGKPMAQ
ncbi:MAG TPA: endolytic transglycosylase MltG [Polyangia bacterium]|nr:endolytic transglycosylase MltG [Polyangia bacterium]